MTELTSRPSDKKSPAKPEDEIFELDEKAPDLVHSVKMDDAFVVFKDEREKPAAGLPDVKVGGDNKAAALPKLEGDAKDRAEYLQQTLSDMSGLFAEKPEEMRAALDAERKAGTFGPASQKAYADYLKFLDTKVLLTVNEWGAIKPTEALPPGCPITLPMDKYQRVVDPQLFKSLASINEVHSDWKCDTTQIPSNEQLDKLDGAFDWLAQCNRSITTARNEFRDRTLTELVKDYGLPEAWNRKPDDNPDAWRASVEEMIDLSVRTRNYAAAMHSLYKSARNDDFPLELPPNTKLTLVVDGKTHVVTDKDLRSPQSRAYLKEGDLKSVEIDLPKDLRQEEPANKQKIDNMRSWLTKHGDKIDQAITELAKLEQNPDSVIMFGDQEVHNAKARLNDKGEFTGVVDPKRYREKPGERLEDMNLIGYDFNVEQINEGPNKGKFKITQNIQAEKAPIWAYLNIRALGIEKVGKPMPTEEKIVSGSDFVWVKNGGKVEMVKASDLSSFKKMQQLHYYGEKGLIAAMDAAMLVTGTIEFSAAIKGARIAATAANAGLALTTRQAVTQGTKAAIRVGVAGAGVFNNAGARDTEGGRLVNNARTAYFIGDIGLGLARTGFAGARGVSNWVRGAEAATPTTLSGADKIHKLIQGGKLPDGQVAKTAFSPWVKTAHSTGSVLFRTTEVGFGYLVVKDIRAGYDELKHAGKRQAKDDALAAVGDGRGLQTVEEGSFDPKKPEVLDSARVLLDNYRTSLKDGKDAATQKQLDDIFEQTKKLMAPDAPAQDKKKQIDTLASLTYNTDKEVVAASRIALLYLSRDKDGKLPEKISYLSSANLVKQMQADLAADKAAPRTLVTGDCLLRVGAISNQSYGAVLQDILNNPEASKAIRMNALTDSLGARMATIVDGLRYEEKDASGVSTVAGEREQGKKFGTSSQDLLRTLENTAKNDKDADVRAMSAALLYGLNEKNLERRSQLLRDFNEQQQRLGTVDGAFSQKALAFLEGELKGAGKLNAAQCLALVTDAKNADKQKAINTALVDSVASTNAADAIKAMDALASGRLEQLTKDDPFLANKARIAALEQVKNPKDIDEADAVVRVLRRMEPFLKSGEVGNKTELVRRLHDMLSISAANKNYAAAYPNLRAAAIDSLAALGHQGSVDVIRTHVAAEKIKIGEQEIGSSEPSAVVRHAAVKALEQLKDAGLRQIVNELIQKETDPSTATQLREVKFAKQRVEPGSEEYSRMYQDALKDVIGDLAKHKHLDGFGSDAQLNWLRQNYDLLDVDTYRDRCNEAAKNAMSGWDRTWSLKETEAYEEQKKVFAVGDQRIAQWDDLVKTAQGSGDRADKAKLALHYILTHNGHPMGGDSGFSIQVNGDKYHKRIYNHDWPDMAARALGKAAETGCGNRDITFWIIRNALKEKDIKSHVSTSLLDGLIKFDKKSADGFAVTREQLAKCTAEALKTELERKHEDQADWYQDFLLKDLQKYRHRMVFPILEAMGDKSKFESVRKQCKAILDEFRNSVSVIWDETAVDQAATADARATRVKQALADNNNAEVTVAEIFKAYKGYNLNNGNDAGLPFLHQAMNDQNERTQFAAAKIILESALPANHPAKVKAIQTFTNMMNNSKVERLKADARAILNGPKK